MKTKNIIASLIMATCLLSSTTLMANTPVSFTINPDQFVHVSSIYHTPDFGTQGFINIPNLFDRVSCQITNPNDVKPCNYIDVSILGSSSTTFSQLLSACPKKSISAVSSFDVPIVNTMGQPEMFAIQTFASVIGADGEGSTVNISCQVTQ